MEENKKKITTREALHQQNEDATCNGRIKCVKINLQSINKCQNDFKSFKVLTYDSRDN